MLTISCRPTNNFLTENTHKLLAGV